MSYNTTRTTRMAQMSELALKQRVDAKTLSSAAARYELKRRGIIYLGKKSE